MMYRKEKNEKDVLFILEHLRQEDKREAIEQKGQNYVEEVLREIMSSSGDYFILGCKKSDDTPVCMGGAAKTEVKGIGTVWLLSTPEVIKYQVWLVRAIKEVFQYCDNNFLGVFNILYKENNLIKVCLKKLGCCFDNPHGLNIPKDFEFFYRRSAL